MTARPRSKRDMDFADQPRIIRLSIALGLICGFCVTLLRGLRRPNDWAEAHWLITYHFGPLKRALPGTLLRLIATDPRNAETTITVVASILTAILCIALIALALSILTRHRYTPNAVVVIAVFLTSPFIVMVGHLNGYFDSQIILLSILALALTLRGHRWAAAVVISIALLIHETIFVLGFPSVLWAALCTASREDDSTDPTTPGRFARHLFPFVLPVLVALALFAFQSFYVDATEIERVLVEYLQDIPFIQYDQEVIVPRAFAKSFIAHFQSQSSRLPERLLNPEMAVAVLPGLAVMLGFAGQICRKGEIRGWLTALGLLIPVLPLGLFLIAWDISRIWTYPLPAALLTIWTAGEVIPASRPLNIRSAALTLIGAAVVIANLFGHIPLMDWRIERFSTPLRSALYSPLLLVVFLVIAQMMASLYTKRK